MAIPKDTDSTASSMDEGPMNSSTYMRQISDSSPGSSTEHRKHKKRHTFGVYPCDNPGCNKVFQRSDHLSRHKLIHDSSSKTFVCSWAECGRKFNRSDTMKLHYNRHLKRLQSKAAVTSATSSPSTPEMQNYPQKSEQRSWPRVENQGMMANNFPGSNIQPDTVYKAENDMDDGDYRKSKTPTVNDTMLITKENNISDIKTGNQRSEQSLQPSDILSFLFPEGAAASNGDYTPTGFTEYVSGTREDFISNSSIEQHLYSLFDPSQNLLLNKIPNIPMPPTDLTTSITSQTYIDQNVIQEMIATIPSLALNPDFHIAALQRSLEIFWSLFGYRLPFLHKASFDSREEQPALLLLAMIMMGAALSYTTDQLETAFVNPQNLADEIAIPLRWAIFQAPELTSPKPWIIQSLMILETFEKHMSSRDLFQRSSIHHSTKVQILRRSTTLGGDPYRKDNFEAETLLAVKNKSSHLWKKWIEAESMKRSAYATFVIDAYNSILTNQPIALYAHQLKLSLPCNAELWHAPRFDQELLRNFEWKNQSYVSAFVEMINEKDTSGLYSSSAVLLSGLVTLITLFQNTSSMKFPVSIVNESWKDMLTYCLESWLVNVRGGCCTIPNLARKIAISSELNATSHYFLPNDRRCKFPIYHLAHVTLRLSNYDWMTYSGSPLLTNVRAEYTDFDTVCLRVRKWSCSKEGGVSVVNAYLALIETLLPSEMDDPKTFIEYQPRQDALFERPYCLGQLAIIIWCYNYSSKGPESGFLDNEMNYTYYLNDASSIDKHVKEDGYTYLNRIKELFRMEDIRFDNLIHDEISTEDSKTPPSTRTKLYHKRILMYVNALSCLKNSHHIAGLMLLLSKMFSKCTNWDLCLELSRLMKHCQSRSMGNKEIKCMNMYSSY